MTRQRAIELGLGRYRGELCSKHRELRGERLTANGYCYGCHVEKRKARRAADPEPFRAKDRKRHSRPEYRAKRRKRDSKPENREAKRARRRKPERRARHRARYRERVATDPGWLLAKKMRTRIWGALRGRTKSARTFRLIGCTVERLRAHIEAQWLPGMSWANYGDWHVDHIRPCASFDLSDPLQQRECFNWRNMQPLWEPDNASKGSVWNGVRYRRDVRLVV
ncbi:MAG TPA: hypothetical protein VH913_15835 [Hyphomicrobiaceae bacterium]|jgi:hypothetical protein